VSAKPDAADAAKAPAKSKKMLIIIVAAVLVLVLGGGAAFFVISKQQRMGKRPRLQKRQPTTIPRHRLPICHWMPWWSISRIPVENALHRLASR
jgi:hypothetical protein